jgi:hypothetical protein
MLRNHAALIGVFAAVLLFSSCSVFAVTAPQPYWAYSQWHSQAFTSAGAACIGLVPPTGYLGGEAVNVGTSSAQCRGEHPSSGAMVTLFSIYKYQNPCADGEEYVGSTDNTANGAQCQPGLEPPPTDLNCTENTTGLPQWGETKIAFVPNGSETGQMTSFCTPAYSKDDQECQNVMGYFNGHQLCADDKDACEASGGTYGAVGHGSDISTAVCIPQDYADDVPTCEFDTVQVALNSDGSGGFVCASPITDPQDDDPVDGDRPQEPDIDNDGTPDKDDPDMDGDGIPNGSDSDADGDGVPDVDDGEIGGEGEENSVSGGGNCASRPQCVGDPIECAVLFQSWSTRCNIEELSGQLGGDLDFDPEEGPLTGEGDGEVPDDGDTDLSSDLTGILSTSGPAGSCPADQVMNLGIAGSINVPYTFLCDFASKIRPLVLLVFGFLGFRIGMRGFE